MLQIHFWLDMATYSMLAEILAVVFRSVSYVPDSKIFRDENAIAFASENGLNMPEKSEERIWS